MFKLGKISENSKNFIRKLQALPDNNKKIIIICIVILLSLVMGYFWLNSLMAGLNKIGQSTANIKIPEIPKTDIKIPSIEVDGDEEINDWNEYKNEKYGFTIKYPKSWSVREFDTKTGAAFYDGDIVEGRDIIIVGFYKRGLNYCEISFDDYVRIAGPSEIQSYESLDTIDNGKTYSGINAYKITWNYTDINNDKRVSLPIIYFDTNKEMCGQIEAFINNGDYIETFNKMILTFNFLEQQ